MNPKIKLFNAAFSQKSNGFDFPVFRETSKYQYSKGLGDLLCGIERFILRVTQFLKLVSIKGIQTFLKAGSKASKTGATVRDVIISTLKPTVCSVLASKTGATVRDVIISTLNPTVCAVLGATVDQRASNLIEMQNNQNDATLPNPPIMLPELNQAR